MDRKQFDNEEGWWISCDYFCVGDYGGAGSIGEANIRALEDREDAIVTHGHYSFKQVWLRDTEDNRELIRGVERGYPLLDEELHSKVEMDWEKEAWDNYLKSDLLRTLDRSSSLYEYADGLDDAVLWHYYSEAMKIENEYPITEYNGVCVRIEKIENTFRDLIIQESVWVNHPEGFGVPASPEEAMVIGDWLKEHDKELEGSVFQELYAEEMADPEIQTLKQMPKNRRRNSCTVKIGNEAVPISVWNTDVALFLERKRGKNGS